MNRRDFTLAAVALAGCATTEPPILVPAASGFAELEPLYGAEARREALTISVGSNGCTVKADFVFYVERRGAVASLAFGRRRIDTCRSFAIGRTDLRFTWAELGVAPRTPVFLLNPLVGWTGPGG